MDTSLGEFVPVSSLSTTKPSSRKKVAGASSLVARCQAVVTANLERYPPEVLGMLCEQEWAEIVQLKHRSTAPLKGSGGLDGTGRRTPALSERFIEEVEKGNPHLADSETVDKLIWKDLVEYRFKRGGLTRPRALLLPWPLLLRQFEDAGSFLMELKKQEDEDGAIELDEDRIEKVKNVIQFLQDSPMNVSLLKASGIGKQVKKVLKSCGARRNSCFQKILITGTKKAPPGTSSQKKAPSALKQLQAILKSWIDLAAEQGVDVKDARSGSCLQDYLKDQEDLEKVERCETWRQLFRDLKDREEKRRSTLGQKMRDNRKNLNSIRPQIIKVRRKSRREQALIEKASARGPSTLFASQRGSVGGTKLLQIRKEAMTQSSRLRSPSAQTKASFGAAVAFASTTNGQAGLRKRKQNMLMNSAVAKAKIMKNRVKRLQK